MPPVLFDLKELGQNGILDHIYFMIGGFYAAIRRVS